VLPGNRGAVFTDVGSAWEHNTWAAMDGGTFNSKAYLEGTARPIEQYVDLHLSYFPATGSARDKFMQLIVPESASSWSAPCPFDGGICVSKDNNVLVDSGLLDSRSEFGLNYPSSQSFEYRRVTECAPLKTDGYKGLRNTSATGRQISMACFYGKALTGNQNWT